MKLFLTSLSITDEQFPAFCELVGKAAHAMRLALIENAADVYAEDKKAWMYDNREALAARGFKLDLLDLQKYKKNGNGLRKRLEQSDVIWLGGGNTYYLRWILRETGADNIIKDLVEQGKVYAGGSAGAIVAGPTLKHFETADDPAQAPETILGGLNLIDTVIVPHWNSKHYGPIVKAINTRLKTDGFKTHPLTDQQALLVKNNLQSVI